MRGLLLLLYLAASASALCIGNYYIYALGDAVYVFEKHTLRLVNSFQLEGGVNAALAIGCVVIGDSLYLGVATGYSYIVVKAGPLGVERRLEIDGLVALTNHCGRVAVLVDNMSHIAIKWFTPNLEFVEDVWWSKADAYYMLVSSGCELWLIEYNWPPWRVDIYYIGVGGSRTLMHTAGEHGEVVPDGDGGVYYITPTKWLRISKYGVVNIGRGVRDLIHKAFIKGDAIYAVALQSPHGPNYVTVARSWGKVERIYLGSRHVELAADGGYIYIYYGGSRLERRPYLPNGTAVVRAASDIKLGNVKTGIIGVGEVGGPVYGPFKVLAGRYVGYVAHCGGVKSVEFEVGDGEAKEVVIEVRGHHVRIVLVDFFRRPLDGHLYVGIYGSVATCFRDIAKSPLDVVLPEGEYKAGVSFFRDVERGGYRTEEYITTWYSFRVEPGGRIALRDMSLDRLFAVEGNTLYIYRDGVTYLELLPAAALFGVFYALDKFSSAASRRLGRR
ncbi:MAG: hypothetical protein ACPL3C_02515 [Pyrobaculum sp.]